MSAFIAGFLTGTTIPHLVYFVVLDVLRTFRRVRVNRSIPGPLNETASSTKSPLNILPHMVHARFRSLRLCKPMAIFPAASMASWVLIHNFIRTCSIRKGSSLTLPVPPLKSTSISTDEGSDDFSSFNVSKTTSSNDSIRSSSRCPPLNIGIFRISSRHSIHCTSNTEGNARSRYFR